MLGSLFGPFGPPHMAPSTSHMQGPCISGVSYTVRALAKVQGVGFRRRAHILVWLADTKE